MNDIIFETTGEVIIKDGDFLVSDSKNQNAEHILIAGKGSFLKEPNIGVGLNEKISGAYNQTELKHLIRNELAKDNLTASVLKIDSNYQIELDVEIINL